MHHIVYGIVYPSSDHRATVLMLQLAKKEKQAAEKAAKAAKKKEEEEAKAAAALEKKRLSKLAKWQKDAEKQAKKKAKQEKDAENWEKYMEATPQDLLPLQRQSQMDAGLGQPPPGDGDMDVP
eukprot:COSAG06_NODE_30634_length_535_cov_0.887615_2_plen_122_part_01